MLGGGGGELVLVDAVVGEVAAHARVVAHVLRHQAGVFPALGLGPEQPCLEKTPSSGELVADGPEADVDGARQQAEHHAGNQERRRSNAVEFMPQDDRHRHLSQRRSED